MSLASVLQQSSRDYLELNHKASEFLKTHNVTIRDFLILSDIVEREPLSIAAISRDIGSKSSLVSVYVDRLVERELAFRQVDSKDQRSNIVSSTQNGRDVIADIEKKYRQHLQYEGIDKL